MSIESNQILLANVNSSDANINFAAQKVNELTEMCKAGQISTEEYTILIEDIQQQVNIQSNMSDLSSLERLNIAINGLIAIARAV